MQDIFMFITISAVLLILVWILAAVGKKFPTKFSIKQKNWWLIAHMMFVILYFSGLFGTLLLTEIAGTTIDRELIYAAHLFGKYCDWYLIIPGAFGSLLTGTWLSIRSQWGLTKYNWIIVKILGNIGAILFGSSLMRIWFSRTVELSSRGQMNPLENPVFLHNHKMLFIGTIISLSDLFFLVMISYFKPWGKRKI